MAINRNFNGASIFKPGAYSRTDVVLAGGFPLAPTGIVAIIGEAEGGAPGSSDGVKTFTSQDIQALISTYKSGPIVDAARVLIAPARDPRVANGASIIRIYKTNASTAATAILENGAPATLFNLTSANFGEAENLINVKVEAGSVDTAARIITIRQGTTKEVLSENANATQLTITYTGAEATCDLTIASNTLTVSAAGDSFAITLAGKSLLDLVDLIDAQANFTATTTVKLPDTKDADRLDPISTAVDLTAGAADLKAQQQELLDIINGESQLITAAKVADVEGTIAATTANVFLTGGTRGATTNAAFQAGFDAHLALRSNIVVPLISQDATALATLGQTDTGSTFTVDAVNLQAVTHCITASNTKNRSERNCYVSKKATFANAQDASQDLNSERASMLFQDVEVLNSSGNLEFKDPWAAAAIVAGIQAGTDVGTPATFKGINVNGIAHTDYNSKTQVSLAIQAGLLPLEERDSGGFRVVVHNSTYSTDANFVFNRPSVLEAADTVAFNLREQLEAIFVGDKVRTTTAQAIKNTVVAIMSTFLNDEIIVGDDTNGGLGYKDLFVTINGNTATVDVTITPVQGIDFILNTITLDNITQTASA